jgi:prepilin-type processing-associated H-X9-DG protein
MYTDDANGFVPPNVGMTMTDPTLNWVVGFLTLDTGDNLGHPGKNNPDNTNTVYLKSSLLWPYHENLDVWRCPADKSMSTIGGRRYPHVRTMSMNNWVGNYDPRTGAVTEYTTGFRVFTKVNEMTDPSPASTFVLLDEREDSINDGSYLMLMDGFSPSKPAARTLVDYPSCYHNNAGGFSFADGHAEIHRWTDPRTKAELKKDFHLSQIPPRSSPDNADVLWIQTREQQRNRRSIAAGLIVRAGRYDSRIPNPKLWRGRAPHSRKRSGVPHESGCPCRRAHPILRSLPAQA